MTCDVTVTVVPWSTQPRRTTRRRDEQHPQDEFVSIRTISGTVGTLLAMATTQNGNRPHQYWLGRLREAEANPGGWAAANPQQGGAGSGTPAPAAAPVAAAPDRTYWLGRLNEAEARARATVAAAGRGGAAP